MNCREFKEMMDSYISDELLVETNHEVLKHLGDCADCRREISAQRALRARIRKAVKNSPEMQINSAFAARLESNLREMAWQPNVWEKLKHNLSVNSKILALAACLLIIAAFSLIGLKHSSSEKYTAESDQPFESVQIPQPAESPLVQAVQTAWREVAQAAVGDHQNCALKFRLEENPITLAEAAAKFGRYNKDLDKAVQAAIKEPASKKTLDKIQFLEAHSCIFQGRRFAHVVLRYRDHVVSMLITDTDLPPDEGGRIANQSFGKMQAASFRAAHQAVFIVSDLPPAENSAIAEMLSPAVRQHIEKAEA